MNCVGLLSNCIEKPPHYTYDNHGNITTRSDVGSLLYGQSRPYALNEIPNPSPLIPAREQRIRYNALSLPDTITEASDTATFTYHADGSRATMTLRHDSTRTETRHYYGDRLTTFERADSAGTQTKSVLLLGGTAYDAPAALVKDYGSDRWKLLHILRDNLGSITHLVDSAGNVVQKLSYTPWGQLRDPETLRPYLPDNQPDLLLDRGFTGHEHLTTFGLINMNARLYDPAAGRFLSPDPYVQAPDNTQNLNRYTYCLNNPLRYVDKTGCYFDQFDTIKYKKYLKSIDSQLQFYKRYVSQLYDATAIQQFNDKINELTKTINDLELLRSDNTNQYIFLEGGGNGSEFAQIGNYKFIISFENFETLVHEVRHAAQYSEGQFKFVSVFQQNGFRNSTPDNSFGLQNEIDAYRAQVSSKFGQSQFYWSDPNQSNLANIEIYTIDKVSDINSTFVRGIVTFDENNHANWLYKYLK